MEFLDSAYFIPILFFILVFTLYMAADALYFRKEQIEQLERKATDDGKSYAAMESDEPDLISMDRDPTGNAASIAGLLRGMGVNVAEEIEKVRYETSRAGLNDANTPYYILFMRRIGNYVIALLGVLYILAGSGGGTKTLLVGAIIIILGLFGTNLWLKNKIQKREKVLLRSFPDTLDLMVVCVESGLALDAALARVCRELGRAHPEITKEFNQTRMELALLNDRSQALTNLAERTNLVAFRSLVAALIQTEKFGTSLTDTLRVLSEDYRQTRLTLAEEKAGKLPVMMTIPLVCLLLPALFLIILGPPFVRISQRGGIFGDK